MGKTSGVGVLDKAVALLEAVEGGPAGLGALVDRSGLPRATAHRLAVALEVHGLLRRDGGGQWVLGARLAELGALSTPDPLLRGASRAVAALRDRTGESAQLYVREGDARVCVAAAERATGLRDTVPVGARLPLTAGSAAQVLLAWEPPPAVARLLLGARFSARTLADVRRRGFAASVGQREAGVASVSAPVRAPDGVVRAALSVSGPVDRLGRSPGQVHGREVVEAAVELSRALAPGAGAQR